MVCCFILSLCKGFFTGLLGLYVSLFIARFFWFFVYNCVNLRQSYVKTLNAPFCFVSRVFKYVSKESFIQQLQNNENTFVIILTGCGNDSNRYKNRGRCDAPSIKKLFLEEMGYELVEATPPGEELMSCACRLAGVDLDAQLTQAVDEGLTLDEVVTAPVHVEVMNL